MNKQNNTRAIAVATLTAICMMAGIARAEDGGSEDHMIPAAYIPGDNGDNGGNAGSDPVTCKDLRDVAWFNHELARSDGEVSPAAPGVECRPDVYAESTVDAD
jgi:hypothetical protein